MGKGRLEAFSDGVIAIIITIMVLELKAPEGGDWPAVRAILPQMLFYVLSFVNVGIYWSNHHHLLYATERVNGAVLWANLHLLFWLSLTPFTTAWMGEHYHEALPTAVYGATLFLSAIAYTILVRVIINTQGHESKLAQAVGGDVKSWFSLGCYVAAIVLAFVNHWISDGLYVAVALIWLVPDSRIEKRVAAAPARE